LTLESFADLQPQTTRNTGKIDNNRLAIFGASNLNESSDRLWKTLWGVCCSAITAEQKGGSHPIALSFPN
jgi:hypothetical protein